MRLNLENMSTKPSTPNPKRAADILVECLSQHGVDRLFLVPGESYLSVLDSLYEETRMMWSPVAMKAGQVLWQWQILS